MQYSVLYSETHNRESGTRTSEVALRLTNVKRNRTPPRPFAAGAKVEAEFAVVAAGLAAAEVVAA